MGDLVALMMTLKSLPLAYNKDLQEDKEGAMDAADTLEDCYVCAAGMIATMTVNADAMAAQAKKGYLAATDVADYLAKKGLPFPPGPTRSWGIWCFCATSAAAIWKTSRWTISRRRAIFSNPISWNA